MLNTQQGNVNMCILYLVATELCETESGFDKLSEIEKVQAIYSKIYVINGKDNHAEVQKLKDSGKTYANARGRIVTTINSQAEVDEYKPVGRIADIFGGSPETLFSGATLSGSSISVPYEMVSKINGCNRMYRSLSPMWGKCPIDHSCWFIDSIQANLLGISGPTYDQLAGECGSCNNCK